MARRVEARHGDKAACPRGLAAHLEAMHASVLEHLQKEERDPLPDDRGRHGPRAGGPVHVMELEHEHHGENLQGSGSSPPISTPPDEACTTWRALYLGLQQLEQELMEHIHLENNVLFRRALASSSSR